VVLALAQCALGVLRTEAQMRSTMAHTKPSRSAEGVGQAAPITGEVERILGRPARTYAQWVADHADAFGTE